MGQIYRNEFKYIISVLDFIRLRKRIDYYLSPDPHSGYDGYRVRSLYFDAVDDRDFYDCLTGSMEKRKIRLRYYPPDKNYLRLEYKCKSGTDGVKRSLVVSPELAHSIVHGDYEPLFSLQDPLASELYGHLMTGVYRPKSIVDYWRVAYSHPVSDTRLNFDTMVSASSLTDAFFENDPGLVPLMAPDLGVFEIKYDYFLVGVIKEIVELVDSMNVANSKYGQSRFLY